MRDGPAHARAASLRAASRRPGPSLPTRLVFRALDEHAGDPGHDGPLAFASDEGLERRRSPFFHVGPEAPELVGSRRPLREVGDLHQGTKRIIFCWRTDTDLLGIEEPELEALALLAEEDVLHGEVPVDEATRVEAGDERAQGLRESLALPGVAGLEDGLEVDVDHVRVRDEVHEEEGAPALLDEGESARMRELPDLEGPGASPRPPGARARELGAEQRTEGREVLRLPHDRPDALDDAPAAGMAVEELVRRSREDAVHVGELAAAEDPAAVPALDGEGLRVDEAPLVAAREVTREELARPLLEPARKGRGIAELRVLERGG